MTKQKKVLVVEDEQTLLKMLTLSLKTNGYVVLQAENGEQAIKEVAKKPDLVLLDILLPGMSGFDVLDRVKADPKTKDIPVIMLTNFNDEERMVEAKKKGAVDYLVKANNDIKEVITKVRSVIEKSKKKYVT